MKKNYKKLILLIIISVMNIIVFSYYSNAREDNKSIINQFKNVNNLISTYNMLKTDLNDIVSFIDETNSEFVLENYVQSVLNELDIRQKIVHFKSIRKNEFSLFEEEIYELRISNISIEEMINLMYKLEIKHPTIKIIGINSSEIIHEKYQYDIVLLFKYTISIK